MPAEWFHAAKVEVFLGVRREDLDALFADLGLLAFLARYKPYLDLRTSREPLTAALFDLGYSAGSTPQILTVEVAAVQIDAGVNEIPQATVRLPLGRDGVALAAGATDAAAAAVGHLLERYVTASRVPARLYCRARTTALAAGAAADGFDPGPWADEWVVLFEGRIVGVSRQGSAEASSMVFHLAHFTADLADSSTLSAQTAAGAYVPAAMSPVRGLFRSANALPPAFTMYGAVTAALAGGKATEADFWGYQVPGGENGAPPTTVGLKGFLALLARNDVFAFENLTRADMGASACDPALYGKKRNDRALTALAKIEPHWPGWTAPVAGGLWDNVLGGVAAIRTERQAAGSSAAVTRGDLIDRITAAGYRAVGYRYGVPVSFYLRTDVLAHLSTGRAFATDVTGASFADLAAHSFWDLVVGPFSSRYQVALAPMADRAVVVPTQPLLDRYWQSIGASEVASWDRDFRTPQPLRGVVLVGDHPSNAGVVVAGQDPSAPGAQDRFQQLKAGYDSCDDGVFEYRAMPPWLVHMWRPAAPAGAATGKPAGRALASVPWATGPVALAAVDSVVGSVVPGANLAEKYAIAGIIRTAAAAPPDAVASTSSRMAKAMYQQERTRHNTLYVTTRFRYDVGPASLVKVELPTDRFVKAALLDQVDSVAYGMVVRVTLVVDCEARTSATHLQIGFARTESQARVGSKLYADSHPFWSCACLGTPWADAIWIRNKLGDGSSIAEPGT